MQQLKSFFDFDRRIMGIVFYIPFIVWLIALILILQSSNNTEEYYFNFIVIQGIFIPFCCWHLLFRYSEIFELGAKETLLPYYKQWVIYDIIRYTVLYFIGLLVLQGLIYLKYGSGVFHLLTLIHLPILLVFYILIGLVTILYTKSTEVALTFISIYTVIEVVTQGTFMPWPRIFFFLPPYWDIGSIAKLVFLGVGIGFLAFFTYRKFRVV